MATTGYYHLGHSYSTGHCALRFSFLPRSPHLVTKMVQKKSTSDHDIFLFLAMQWLLIAPRKKARMERMPEKVHQTSSQNLITCHSPYLPVALKNISLHPSCIFRTLGFLLKPVPFSALLPGITYCPFRSSLAVISSGSLSTAPHLHLHPHPGLGLLCAHSMHQLAGAAVTNRLHGLNSKFFPPHNSGT